MPYGQDDEIYAITEAFKALEKLPVEAAERALGYLHDRLVLPSKTKPSALPETPEANPGDDCPF